LTELSKLLAPVIPFLTEEMYQNLRAAAEPESVHLCVYPQADESLIDARLSADMEALLRLVTLGSAARNTVKIKVRQPLAELRVQPGTDADRRAVERFADQLQEELNIKRVTLHDAANGPLLTSAVKANMKTLGPKFGPRLQEVKAALEGLPATVLEERLKAGLVLEIEFKGGPAALDAADFSVTYQAADGWAGVADRGTQVALDARITDELAREGIARDVVRHVQDSRKGAGLEMEDRIELNLDTDADKLRQAIAAHRDYIGAETLVARWADTPLNGEAYRANVKVDGQPLRISLRKSTT
jgi:isoleucyl-tRNA synthetase